MRHSRNRGLRLASTLVFGGLLAGCTIGAGVGLRPNSHFAYPNSNVTPLGRVQGEASITSVFVPTIGDANAEEEAIANALKQKGGDLLIDYVMTTEIVYIPIPFVPVFTTTYRVDGTAAKMVIGQQQIR